MEEDKYNTKAELRNDFARVFFENGVDSFINRTPSLPHPIPHPSLI
jgi:hypothetical protein